MTTYAKGTSPHEIRRLLNAKKTRKRRRQGIKAATYVSTKSTTIQERPARDTASLRFAWYATIAGKAKRRRYWTGCLARLLEVRNAKRAMSGALRVES